MSLVAYQQERIGSGETFVDTSTGEIVRLGHELLPARGRGYINPDTGERFSYYQVRKAQLQGQTPEGYAAQRKELRESAVTNAAQKFRGDWNRRHSPQNQITLQQAKDSKVFKNYIRLYRKAAPIARQKTKNRKGSRKFDRYEWEIDFYDYDDIVDDYFY